MPDPKYPEVRRVSYADHASRAVEGHPDPDEAGRLAREATLLAPLQAIQVAYDQLVTQATDVRRGTPFSFQGGWPKYTADVRKHVNRLCDVLRCAADAADSMIAEMDQQLRPMEAAMTQQNPDEGPQLTTSGAPHPLQEGGYDPDADPALPGNISDIEALKEGKTTRKQAEALAAADAKGDEGREPTPSEARRPPDEAKGVTPPSSPPADTTKGEADDLAPPPPPVKPEPPPEPKGKGKR